MATIKITKADLAQKIEEGWKKDKLAAHYKLPMAQMTKVLQVAGLKIRKFHAPKFELIDEEEVLETVESVDTEENISDVTDSIQEEVEEVSETVAVEEEVIPVVATEEPQW